MTARTSARHGPDEDGRSDEERHDTAASGEECDLVSLLATLPEHVADWLIETIEAVAADPAGPASVGTSRLTGPTTVVAGGPDPVDDPALARAVAGDLIRAARGIQAWAESAEIEGVRRLLAAVEADHNLDLGQHDPPSRRTTRCGLARTAVATELQVLTGLPLTQCRDRVALASAPESRAGYLRARIASGTTSIYRATTVLKETEHLDPFTADEIARRALRPIDGKATKSSDPQAGGHHGMARLDLSAEADRVFAAHERIDRLARKARAEGDPRNLAQLRSDVATDLLVHGTVPDDQLLGDAPPGRVHVVVCLSTLLGLDQLPAEIPGSGLLTAAQARRVALRAGSTWRRIVTDPTTGAAIDSSRTYRPTQAMREHVLARDRTCRAPGCEIVGTGVDLDHVREWCRDARRPADGATHPDNLVLLHRGHHNPKTRRWWKVQPGASGTLRWKTLTGREITTRPGSYRDLTERAAGEDVSFLEARGARRLEELGNPRPLTPEEAALHDHLAEGRRPR